MDVRERHPVARWLESWLWAAVWMLCAWTAGANIQKGQFGCPSYSQATWTTGTDMAGAWYSSAFDTTGSQAALTYSNTGTSDERVLFQAAASPAAGTYQFTFRAKFSATTQVIYAQVLGLKNNTTLSLTAGGVPKVIVQSGVKSYLLVTPAAANGNGNWYTYSGTFTLSVADAAAYKYVGIALVGAKTAGQVLQFDDVNTDMPTVSTDSAAGLKVDWFNIANVNNISALSWTSPVLTTQEETINWINTATAAFSPTIRTDYFALHATGTIKIPTTGTWTFYLGSDDGSQLKLNGATIISAPTPQGFATKSAAVALSAGSYPIEVYYYEDSGSQGCVLSWFGPGMLAQEVIPYSAFSKVVRVTRWFEIGQDGE